MFLKCFKRQKEVDIQMSDCLPLVIFTVCIKNQYVAKMICIKENDEILISDIRPCDWENKQNKSKYINKRYGTELMMQLLKYAQQNNVRQIYGNLSCNDLDHKDRLHHFYQKFGFEIIEFKELKDNYYGKIVKDLG